MSSSEQRLAANRTNASKSTGPRSANGKAVSCLNATRHGLFSARLLLDDEDPAEFQCLLSELSGSLRPVGAIEHALVERIAVTIWRQRRLVSAETAALSLARQPMKTAKGVSNELDLTYSGGIRESDLQPFDKVQADWCRMTLDEIDALEEAGGDFEMKALSKAAPSVYAQLVTDADDESEIETFLADHKDGFKGYIAELGLFCRTELGAAERRPHILALSEQVKVRRLVLPEETLELFARYQTTLDNQLYKALRALREAQEWRLKTLDLASKETEPVV